MVSLKMGLNREGLFGKSELRIARCRTGGPMLGTEGVRGTKQSVGCIGGVRFSLVTKSKVVRQPLVQVLALLLAHCASLDQ